MGRKLMIVKTKGGVTAPHIPDSVEISPRDAAYLINVDGNTKILDVRSRGEYAVAHIQGALLLDGVGAVHEIMGWPKGTPIVVYSHHGQRSLKTVRYFLEEGFVNMKSLAGGIDAWSTQVDPSVPRY